MKRSGNVGLVVMGAAAFAATFGGGMAYFAWQKPSHAAAAQTAGDQTCTSRQDGTQNCQPPRRSFAYYLFPSFAYGSSASASGASEAKPRAEPAAFASNSRTYSPAGNSPAVTRGGFGSTASSAPYRVSAGG
jgi:hypothetical protein